MSLREKGLCHVAAWAGVLASLCLARVSLAAEQPASVPESRSTDVVVLALASLDDPKADHRKHVRERLNVDSNMEPGFDALFKAQMDITRKTAPFGPVLLIAPDETTKSLVYQNCKQLQICDLFRGDRIRMKVVPHNGPWVRDFGPQIESVAGNARAVHWKYFDNRAEEARQESLEKLEAKLGKLYELKVETLNNDLDVGFGEMTEEQQALFLRELDSQISFLRDYTQFLRESLLQRASDETSAYDFADAVLQDPHFKYASSKAAVDGGNLLKLEDGHCLTTRVLLSRNKESQLDVYRELRDVGGCADVIFLDPLPGPVIEHVDMFALPVGGKRILLASYDLTQPAAEQHWSELSGAEKYLSLNAALAMDRNAARLTRLGYEVIKVQSPFPRIPKNEDPYYPTVLNALVRSGKNASHQILLPVYEGYEKDIQDRAREQIEEAFGPKTELATVESTATAKGQGAVHCLTITVPLSLSIFNDTGEEARRSRYLARKEELDRAVVQQVVEKIPPTGEQGLWAMLEEGEHTDKDAANAEVRKIHFAQSEFQIGAFNHIITAGQYEIQKPEANRWSLVLRFADGDTDEGVLQWEGRDLAKVTFPNKTMLLMRLNDDAAVPFEPEESPQQAESSPNNTPSPKHHHNKKHMGPNQTPRAAASNR